MKIHRLLLPLCSAALLVAVAPAQQQLPGKAKPVAPRSQAPVQEVKTGDQVRWLANWSLRDVAAKADAEHFRFASLFASENAAQNAKQKAADAKRPKLVVVTFWSCKCPWQNAWDPELSAIAKDYASKGVRVIGIDSNKAEVADPSMILKYREKTGLGFPVLLDPGNQLADRFGAKTTPHIYLIDAKGKVLYTGAVDNDARQELKEEDRQLYLRDALDAALAGKAPPKASTPPKGCGIKRAKRQKSDTLPARG